MCDIDRQKEVLTSEIKDKFQNWGYQEILWNVEQRIFSLYHASRKEKWYAFSRYM